MKDLKPHNYDAEQWDDEEDQTTFVPLRKQSNTTSNIKNDRRQREKEWGRAVHKFHKQRDRSDKP